jgi:hypothetical protein
MRIRFLCLAILILALFDTTLCAPDESYGVVSKIVDANSFNIVIEKADPRISYGTERVVLADIEPLDMSTSEGLAARDLATAVLLNKRVFLDMENLDNGRDTQGRLVCVVYLSGYYGQPLLSPCYNRILVDSGLAMVNASKNNEFTQSDWWPKTTSSGLAYNDSTETLKRMETVARDLLGLQRELGNEYDKRSKEAAEWLRKQLSIK